MKRFLAVALGILTAIGGFVDIGDLVTNAQVGARFGFSMAWVVPVGVLGICVFAEMSGRIAAVSGRATFDLVRERLGPRMGFANLLASMGVTLLTFIAEIGGVALSLQLVSSVNELLIVPLVGLLVWLLLWRAKFSAIENVLGLLGLALIVFAVALWKLGPDWAAMAHQAVTLDKPGGESWTVYSYYVVALFGAAMTPYEVFFFSSGGVEERWSLEDIPVMRANVLIGFPLGGLLSLAIAGCTAVVFGPVGITVDTLGQVGLPIAVAFGKVGVAVVIVGFTAATFGAACETGVSVGYSIAQYFGAQWGKYVKPSQAAGFHLILLVSTLLATAVLLAKVNPILVTEFSVVFSAVALPLTYFPILVVANDPDYLGAQVNGRLA
ncbi:divalent metal cation transporter, partial [Nocardioides sp.]|uniref:NRAMP family divalent metal transporter n=1 Tax=Nocardioides sp. TaxID=35761 RepID=UPI0031FF1401|nr:natural resistance-associated macrophage protein [Nocardioides sp.]